MSKRQKTQTLLKGISAGAVALLFLTLALLGCLIPRRKLVPARSLPLPAEGEVLVHFPDVGQGDCTVIAFPDFSAIVIDAGNGSFTASNALLSYLNGLHLSSVTLVLTHADIDHYGGAEALIGEFPVERCYLPVLPAETAEYRSLLSAIEERGIEVGTLTRYSVLDTPYADLVCLSPYSSGEEDKNESSTVLYMDCGGFTALFAGDLTTARERKLVREYAIDQTLFDSGGVSVRLDGIDLLRAAHHGSESSSCAEWMGLLRPSVLIVATGRGNSYRLPADGALADYRAAVPNGEIYRTDELGDVVVSVKQGKYTVFTVKE